MEALLFSMHLCAVASMNDETSRRVLGTSRSDLMIRFSRAAEQALINANFLRSTNILILQALSLYLVCDFLTHLIKSRLTREFSWRPASGTMRRLGGC
jgi:hypothetical protein